LARLWPWLAVLAVVLLAGYIRVRLLNLPLERDEGEYAYAGQLLLQGIPPYELAYNMKLPGTYFACAAGMKLFGETIAGLRLTLLLANALTIVFVFLLGRKLFGVTAGVVACASYAVLSMSGAVLGLAAHANHFVVLFAVPATLLLWWADDTRRLGLLFFSGLLFGLAFLMKQPGIFFGLFGALFLVGSEIQNPRRDRAYLVKALFCLGTGMILPLAATCIYLKLAGVFPRFWFWTFTYAQAYGTEISLPEGLQILRDYLAATFNLYFGFWILAVAGLLAAFRCQHLQKQVAFALIFLAGSFACTAMGFHFWRHYFILLLPVVSIFVGMGVGLWQQLLREKKWHPAVVWIPAALFIIVLGGNIFMQRDIFFQMTGAQVIQKLYPQEPFNEVSAVANYIATHSKADARIAVIGSEPEIYFEAQRHSATGYIYTYALMEPQTNALVMQREMISEIETNHPEYLVYVGYGYSWIVRPSSDQTIFHWFHQYAQQHYDRVGFIAPEQSVHLWGDAAKNYSGPAEQYLSVYKRKKEQKDGFDPRLRQR
jgi:4-amino-4-deoxy-L-arabinose transferase-like glycosyltransferase